MGRLLLIGATGFVARHFRAVAESAGHEVIGAARSPGASALTCDLLDRGSLAAAMRAASPAAVVNLAGEASVAASFRDPAAAFEVNAAGAFNLLEAVAEHAEAAQVLCISSGEVYGAPAEDEMPLREERPVMPINPYATSKACMELLCSQFQRHAGLRIAVLRAFNHTGPGQSDSFAASSWARQIAEAERSGEREILLKTGDLQPARDFSDARDVATAYLRVVERALTGTFNVCSGTPTRLGEIAAMLADATPLRVRTEIDAARLRPSESPVLYGSPERLSAATGWRPEIPLARTTADLLAWWRERIRA